MHNTHYAVAAAVAIVFVALISLAAATIFIAIPLAVITIDAALNLDASAAHIARDHQNGDLTRTMSILLTAAAVLCPVLCVAAVIARSWAYFLMAAAIAGATAAFVYPHDNLAVTVIGIAVTVAATLGCAFCFCCWLAEEIASRYAWWEWL